VFVGYTVTSVVSALSGQLYVAGAPRFNHTGKVIIFTLKNTGELTILHSLKGQQVNHLNIKHAYKHLQHTVFEYNPHVFSNSTLTHSSHTVFACLQLSCMQVLKSFFSTVRPNGFKTSKELFQFNFQLSLVGTARLQPVLSTIG